MSVDKYAIIIEDKQKLNVLSYRDNGDTVWFDTKEIAQMFANEAIKLYSYKIIKFTL